MFYKRSIAYDCTCTVCCHCSPSGDSRLLETYYDGVAQHLLSLEAESNHSTGLLDYSVHGDWCSLQGASTGCRKNSSLVSTFYYILQLDLTAKYAQKLGKTDDATKFAARAKAVRGAFQTAFYQSSEKMYVDTLLEPQTTVPLALQLGVVPEADLEAVVGNLVKDIVELHENHLNTGQSCSCHWM